MPDILLSAAIFITDAFLFLPFFIVPISLKKAEKKEFKIIIPKATFKGIWYLTTLLMRTEADARSAAEDNS